MKRLALLFALTGAPALSQGITSCNCIRSWIPQDSGSRTCYNYVAIPTAAADMTCRCYVQCTNGRYLHPSFRIWWYLPGGGSGTGGTGALNGGPAGYAGGVHGWVVLYCSNMAVEAGQGKEVQRCDGEVEYNSFELTCAGGGAK